jgi:hypothetical protein
MSGKMTVIYLDHTGHVAAAMREPPSGPPTLDALVGSAFRLGAVRSKGGSNSAGSFDLPASVLKSKSVVLDERVIAAPQRFAIDSDQVALLPDPPVSGPSVQNLSQTAITLRLAAAPSAPTKVLSIVRGAAPDYGEQRIQAGSFEITSATLVLNLTIVPSGPEAGLRVGVDCYVCIAVAGLRLIYVDGTTA